jgi:flagellar hook assembly protein FlgD
MRVQILTVAGRRVRELQAEGQAGQNYIFWDGLDSAGEKVAIGVYLIRVIADTPGGGHATAMGRALRTE